LIDKPDRKHRMIIMSFVASQLQIRHRDEILYV
jgi:hypothetical protein